MKILKIRPYQRDANEAVVGAWDEGLLRPAVVLPTGAGKTVTFANLIARVGVKTLVLVHRDELAKQAADKLRAIAPDMSVGIVKAEQNEVDADVVVASVQTLFNPGRREQIRGVELVVVDECHHYVAPAYMEVLEHFGVFEKTRCVGYTATMTRTDSLGLGDVWEDVVYKKDILWAIINEFLVDVEAQAITIDGLNLADIARRKGDYQEGKLGEALVTVGAGITAATEYRKRAGERQGIVFCPTVACAEHFLESFNDEGIPSELVVGTTPIDERQRIYQRYREKQTQVLVSVMALTEGFDMPQAEVGVMARPTSSAGLYQQMAGRLLRLFPGKQKALLLDLVGATEGASLCGLVDLSETDVVPTQGESLAEAYERSEREKKNATKDAIKGTVNSRVVQLFKQSSSVWLQTPGGYWFIPTKEGYIFLWSYEGGFKVGITGKNSMTGGRMLKDEVLDLPYAMAWGEQLAEEIDPSTSQRSASWRKKKQKPSDAQLGLAKSLGIEYDEGVRKDEMSDLISTKLAARILDRIKRS